MLSSEVKCRVGDVGDVSERVFEKFSMLVMFGLSYGEPPLSRTKTLAFCERVAASGHPAAVSPPMIM